MTRASRSAASSSCPSLETRSTGVNNLSYLRDPKTALQEYVQKKYKERPVYQVIEERGPDHQKEFTVSLVINGREIVTGEGPSKRKAEMNAARASLKKIEDGDIDI